MPIPSGEQHFRPVRARLTRNRWIALNAMVFMSSRYAHAYIIFTYEIFVDDRTPGTFGTG